MPRVKRPKGAAKLTYNDYMRGWYAKNAVRLREKAKQRSRDRRIEAGCDPFTRMRNPSYGTRIASPLGADPRKVAASIIDAMGDEPRWLYRTEAGFYVAKAESERSGLVGVYVSPDYRSVLYDIT